MRYTKYGIKTTLPLKISIPNNQEIGHASSAPKETYIVFKVIITTAISIVIMLLLIFIKFDLGIIFK